MDHYAYCIVRLIRHNTNNRNGGFFQKQISDTDKESRIWMAILGATQDMAKARRDSLKAAELYFNIKRDIWVDSPNQPMPNQASNDSTLKKLSPMPKPASNDSTPKKLKLDHLNKDHGLLPQFGTPALERAFSDRPNLATPSDVPPTPTPTGTKRSSTQQQSGEAARPDQPDRTDITGEERNITGAREVIDVDALPDTIELGLPTQIEAEVNVEDGQDILSDTVDTPDTNNDKAEDIVDKFRRLYLTSNKRNPLDLNSEFGKYATIHLVLRHFADRAQLSRLSTGPVQIVDDTEEFNSLTDQ